MAKKLNKREVSSGVMWIALVAVVLGFAVGYLMARSRYMEKISLISVDLMKTSDQLSTANEKLNKYQMLNGEMVTVKDGSLMMMDGDATLPDGTKVMTDGTVIRPDGKEEMMHDGDWVNMEGQMMKTPMQTN